MTVNRCYHVQQFDSKVIPPVQTVGSHDSDTNGPTANEPEASKTERLCKRCPTLGQSSGKWRGLRWEDPGKSASQNGAPWPDPSPLSESAKRSKEADPRRSLFGPGALLWPQKDSRALAA